MNDDYQPDEPPFKLGKRLWSEDDAGTPDRERIGDAWLRLFGEPLPIENLATRDDGDTISSIKPNGHIAGCSCGLDFICEVG